MANKLIAATTIVVAVVSIGCASATGGSRPATCDAEPRDSVFAASGPVYHACAVDHRATVITRGSIDFHPTTPATECFSADLEFVVAPNGKPEVETAQVVRTNSQPFADAVLVSLAHWRYEPATRNGVPVRQIVTEHPIFGEIVIRVPKGSVPHLPDRGPQC